MPRALLSVSDKTGLIDFARALHDDFGFDLLSTGGTARHLRDAGLPVTDVSDVTGFPEMMDGRVKTLHPKIHGGLLARRNDPAHVAAMREHGIEPIDLVCVNLYPFAQTIAKPNVTLAEAIENIDIGGPSMIRSAAKNYAAVTVVTSPGQYEKLLEELRISGGKTSVELRQALAIAAFHCTADYDAFIARYLSYDKCLEAADGLSQFPPTFGSHYRLKQTLRYGENPHQPAALYVKEEAGHFGPCVAQATQLHGKELSYINLLDAEAAVNCVFEFDAPAACIVKHATPCGVAVNPSLDVAFSNAYRCDPLAAFGGIVAVNRTLDAETARQFVEGQKFLEVVVAPGFSDDALAGLRQRWKNVRLLRVDASRAPDFTFTQHFISAGVLMQHRDLAGHDDRAWRVVSRAAPSQQQRADLHFAWLACKHVKSNAIVLAKDNATVGIGGGQVDRVGAAKIAIEKAGGRANGAVAASDAFFPFADGPKQLLDAGVTAIIQPGGSVRDIESIAAVDDAGAVMIFTGERHFRH